MKTKAEYRTEALLLAKENGFDKVHFQGLFENREVYTCDYNVPCVTGLPKIILTNEKGIEFDTSSNPFTILQGCKKLPSVVFEYDCFGWCGPYYTYKLLADGRFIKTDYDEAPYCQKQESVPHTDKELIESKELVKAVKQVIKENHEELKKLPRNISNPFILDGASETIKLGCMKFSGCNILTLLVEDCKKRRVKDEIIEPFLPIMQNLYDFQKIFKKVQRKINEFVNVRFVE